ncbi:S8 family serine peptidase [Geodermatophilus sp. SYSU D01105]
MAVVATATLGFGGAAVIDTVALAAPLEIADAADYGPAGDGLTRLVVTVPGGVTDEQLAALAQPAPVDSAQRLFDGSALVAGDGLTPDDVRAVLPGAAVEPSVPGRVAAESVSDPYWPYYGWNLANTGSNAYGQQAVAGADVDAPAGWQAGTGRGVTVAVVDTGVVTSHPDLAGGMWRNPDEICGSPVDNDGNGYAGDCAGWNFYRDSPDVVGTGNAHGTGVAGIAGARAGNGEGSAGVAPGVTLMPLVVGEGSGVDLWAGAQAIRYAADNGADVINASWGGPGGAAILQAAIDYANSKGVVVVAAAGNDALDRDTSPFYPASLSAPNLVTVGNSTAADTVSSSSAYGRRSVHLFAPGELVFAPRNDGGYWLMTGTSMAAPQVAAAVALYRAQDPDAPATELRTRLLEDVDPVAAFAGRSVTGGRLSLSALGAAVAPVAYTFSGMTADAGTVTPTVVATGSAPAGAFSVRFALGMEHEGRLLALTRHPVTFGGATVATDDAGEAAFSLGHRSDLGSAVLSPSADLAEGRYVLSAQVFRDGAPLGPAYAAPLLVGAAYTTPDDGADSPSPSPVPGSDTPAPGGSTPAPGSSSPVPGGSTPVPGGSGPAPTSPAPGAATPAPGTGTPPTPGTRPGGSSPSAPSTPPTSGGVAPGAPTPDTDHGSGGQRDGSGSPAPGGSTPPSGGSSPAPGTSPAPGSTTPAPGSTTPAPGGQQPGSTPDLGGQRTYPEVGPFRLTSIAPSRVSVTGGARVTITGGAIPGGVRVRVGDSAAATVVGASTTSVTFTAPARAAGSYDVHVFAPDGTSSVLTAGLTYVAASGGSGPAVPAPPTAPSAPSSPGTGGQPPGGGDRAADGSVPGPDGQRLLYSARFAALGSAVWALDCRRSCSGLAV